MYRPPTPTGLPIPFATALRSAGSGVRDKGDACREVSAAVGPVLVVAAVVALVVMVRGEEGEVEVLG